VLAGLEAAAQALEPDERAEVERQAEERMERWRRELDDLSQRRSWRATTRW
jgi:hypothetical protein